MGETTLMGPWENAQAGMSLAADDLDADGYGDLVVGAPYSSSEERASGRAFVVHGPIRASMNLDDAVHFMGEEDDSMQLTG